MKFQAMLLYQAFLIMAFAQFQESVAGVSSIDVGMLRFVAASPMRGAEDSSENSTEISAETAISTKHAFPMFDTGTGLNLVEYLREKLDEEEPEMFKHDKELIDAAIVEYHKYLELTKNWVTNVGKNYAYVVPSKMLDLVWHWHILQTYEYHLLCEQQFNGVFLHHRPYFGKEKLSFKFRNRSQKYSQTLQDYTRYFGYSPPSEIWGSHEHSKPMAKCEQMHVCNSKMAGPADCEVLSLKDSRMARADCNQMHVCNSKMDGPADCDQMHACDAEMVEILFKSI